MNEATEGVGTYHSQQPQNYQKGSNGEKHPNLPPLNIGQLTVRSYAGTKEESIR
jgi:hypothetical protein